MEASHASPEAYPDIPNLVVAPKLVTPLQPRIGKPVER